MITWKPGTAKRLINSVFCYIEFVSLKQILAEELINKLKKGISAEMLMAEKKSKENTLILLLLDLLVCMKIAKKRDNVYSLAFKDCQDLVLMMKYLTERTEAEAGYQYAYGLADLIVAYNCHYISKYLHLFSGISEKRFIGNIMPLLGTESRFDDFSIFLKGWEMSADEMKNIISRSVQDESPLLIGGFSLTKRRTGPRHGILMAIASVIGDYKLDFRMLRAIHNMAKREGIRSEWVKLGYGYNILIINPRERQGRATH